MTTRVAKESALLPTREGTTVLALAAASFLLATNLMSGLLFALDALFVSLLIAGAISAAAPLRRLRVSRTAPPRAEEGRPVELILSLEAGRAGRLLLVEDGCPGSRGRAFIPEIAAGHTASAEITVTPSRRGLFEPGPVEVTCRGVVGLFAARRRIGVPGAITVWPSSHPLPEQVLEHLAPSLTGVGSAGRTRQPADFYGLRDYQRGDSLAHVHWRSSARRGALVVREFELPQAPSATLILDLDRSQPPERIDAAARAAASVLRSARDLGIEMVVLAYGEGPVERRGWEAAMDWLAVAEPCGPPLEAALGALGPKGAGAVVISLTDDVPRDGAGLGVTFIVPAGEAGAGRGSTPPVRPAGLVYTPDGRIEAW